MPTRRKGKGRSGFGRSSSPITGRPSISHDPEVRTWVRDRYRDGWNRERIVAASVAGTHGYPAHAKKLTNGTVSEIRACIVAVEQERGQERPAAQKSSEGGRRLRELYAQRKEAGDNLLLQARIDISKITQHIEIIDFPRYGLRDADQDTIADIYRELTVLAGWIDMSYPVVAREVSDLKKRELIRKLRDTTGRGPVEAARFNAAADRLESEMLGLTA